MNKFVLSIIVISFTSVLCAGGKLKYKFYKGAVVEVKQHKSLKMAFLKIKTSKDKVIGFSAFKILKDKNGKFKKDAAGKYIYDEIFLKRVLDLKVNDQIKIKRLLQDCECYCMVDFKLIK
ncbi:MAG: hypothetical protein HRT89_16290 [Lentisphaeria bacterium]|nr:hypothetical protein [Lentisphaeria bacterium]NQZ69619.1 hypothetical protein [Lentisphaeria bacterium]